MSDLLPQITTERDWQRVRSMQDDAIKKAKAECEKQGLSADDRAIYITNAALPYFKLMTDPMNPVATAAALKDAKMHEPGKIRELTAAQQPLLFAELARDTTALNASLGVHYPLPRVLVVEGFSKTHSGALLGYDFTTDSVTIDANYYASYLKDPESARAALGHELTHRYQRDQMMPLKFKARFEELPPADLATVRRLESDADRGGATLVSSQAMARAMTQALTHLANDPQNIAITLYQQHQNLPLEQVAGAYSALPNNAKKELIAEVVRMTKPQREVLSNAFIANEIASENRYESYIDHPAYATRMQDLLGKFAPPAGMPYSDGGTRTAQPIIPVKPAANPQKR